MIKEAASAATWIIEHKEDLVVLFGAQGGIWAVNRVVGNSLVALCNFHREDGISYITQSKQGPFIFGSNIERFAIAAYKLAYFKRLLNIKLFIAYGLSATMFGIFIALWANT